MDIKDITNYVRQTPGNTNPSVIRSMVEAQVGEYVDEAANEALRKLGIDEKVLMFPFNGDTSGKTVIPLGEYSLVKVADSTIDLSIVNKIVFHTSGADEEIAIESLSLIDFGNGQYLMTPDQTIVYVYTVLSDMPIEDGGTVSAGMYVYYAEGSGGANYLKSFGTETIRPIDLKFMPSDDIAKTTMEKLGIKEATEEKVLLDEHLAPGDEFDPGTGVMYDGTLDLVAGKTYTIVTNSGTYKATCKLFGGYESLPYVGNVALMGGEDTGESFLVFFDGANEMVSAIDFNGGTHMKVSEVTEIIIPIKDDYLPMDTIAEATMKKLGIREEKSKNVYFQEQTFVCDEDGYYELSFYPEVGRTYTVLVNGTEYKTKAIIATIEGEDICLGNIGRFGLGFEDTGEPWAILHYPGESFSLFVWIDGTEKEVTLFIYEETETITSIKDEYIPMDAIAKSTMQKLGIDFKETRTWLLPEQSFVMEPIMDGTEEGIFGGTFTPVGETLPEELCFVINGVVYKSKKQTMEHNANTVGWYGNAALFSPDDFEETQDNFFVMLAIDDGTMVGAIIDPDTGKPELAGTTHILGIYSRTETATTINPKYLPEGGVGYTELTKNIIAQEQTVECIYNPELNGCFTGIILASTQPTPPKKLYFSVDGAVYECEKKLLGDEVVYGNLSVAGESEDTGEPFLFMYDNIEIWEGLFKGDTTFSCAISVWIEVEAIHQINPKYLPGAGGGLPAVVLETALKIDEFVTLSEADCEKLDAVPYESPAIIYISFPDKDMYVNTAFTYIYYNNTDAYMGMIPLGSGIISVSVFKSENVWSAHCVILGSL